MSSESITIEIEKLLNSITYIEDEKELINSKEPLINKVEELIHIRKTEIIKINNKKIESAKKQEENLKKEKETQDNMISFIIEYFSKKSVEGKKTKTVSNEEYLILNEDGKKEEGKNSSTTTHYILYKNGVLYTYKSKIWHNSRELTKQGKIDVELLPLTRLESTSTFNNDFQYVLKKLYNDLQNNIVVEKLEKEIINKYNGINLQGLIYKKEVDGGKNRTGELLLTLCYIYYENNKLYYAIGYGNNEEKELMKRELIDTDNARDSMNVIDTLTMLKTLQPIEAYGTTQPYMHTPSGGKRIASAAPAYKSTGVKVRLFIDNKKLHRSIYVKGNGKYCKINNEFILLSKLKNKIID